MESVGQTYLHQGLTFLIATVVLLVTYFVLQFTYWYRKKVPYVKPSFPFGNFGPVFFLKHNIGIVSNKLYKELKSKGHKYGGIYFMQTPMFMPTDPALIKEILSTSFDHFSDRGVFFNENKDPCDAHLFNLPPEPWKKLRKKMSPTFTSGKIKMMFETMMKCGNQVIETCSTSNGKSIDINDLAVRYTVDIIGNCAFGVECNSLKNPDEKFRKIAEKVINPPIWNGLKVFLSMMSPGLIKYLNLTIMETALTRFFTDIVKQIIDHRNSSNESRSDFFQMLVDMKNADEKLSDVSGMKMTPDLIAAQVFVFFAAGFETSSITITLCLFELSQNQEIQDKVRCEIKKVLKEHNGELTYEALKSMTYLDCCVKETLRMYTPLDWLLRVCTKNYKIPDSNVILEKGRRVLISLKGLHYDPEYFPDPKRFDPDRFNDENKSNIIPFTYMPFGEGQRICIGARMGKVQSKVCLVSLLNNFKFTLDSKTKLPLEFSASSFVISLKDQILLKATKV